MKLNPDCIKVIMLYLEDNLKPGKTLSAYDLMSSDVIAGFTRDDVDNSLVELSKENLISCKIRKSIDGSLLIRVTDIEPNGHKFCSQVKDNGIWNKVKPHLESITTIGEFVKLLTQIALTIPRIP